MQIKLVSCADIRKSQGVECALNKRKHILNMHMINTKTLQDLRSGKVKMHIGDESYVDEGCKHALELLKASLQRNHFIPFSAS